MDSEVRKESEIGRKIHSSTEVSIEQKCIYNDRVLILAHDLSIHAK
jgi:hypothetical protein